MCRRTASANGPSSFRRKRTTTFRFEKPGWRLAQRTGTDDALQIDVVLELDAG